MKGHVVSSGSSKRKWNGFALVVIVLVFLSLLVPLAFLLGLHNRFPYGHRADDSWKLSSALGRIDKIARENDLSPEKEDHTKEPEILSRRFGPSPSKEDETFSKTNVGNPAAEYSGGDNATENSTFPSPPADILSEVTPTPKTQENVSPLMTEKIGEPVQKSLKSGDDIEKTCQLEFGSYCLWSARNKEKMHDSLVKKMKDQLFVARSLYPSIAKLRSAEKLSLRLKQKIQDHERTLSETLVDADLPLNAEKQVQSMEEVIRKAKSLHLGCFNINKKLQQILEMTEDEAHFHRRQSAFLFRLGVQTLPKSLHCLPLRLTIEYFNSPPSTLDQDLSQRFIDPSLHHYIIFSTNVLASSVVINSTVTNTEESETLVFHLLTDSQNLFSMRSWFLKNDYKKAAIEVIDIEDYLTRNSNWVPQPPYSLTEEFQITIPALDQSSSNVNMRTEYISSPGHLYFLLPDIFKGLKRIIVLGDDVVVRRDLSPLWIVDLEEKVNAAVEFCGVRLGDLEHYLGETSYSRGTCLFLSGLNVVDLDKWRDLNITGTYEILLRDHMKGKSSERSDVAWRYATLPLSTLALQDHVYVLNDSWVLSGLGTTYSVSADSIENAAVLHYNGKMKPWLELGIPKYKTYWKDYLPQRNVFMEDCNVS